MKKADYWVKKQGGVLCELCPRYCLIKEGSYGYCNARANVSGTLRSIVYGNPTGFQVDPIEKKPFYHFNPGARVYSFGTMGCNMRCRYCCNWFYSQEKPVKQAAAIAPSKIIKAAIDNHCHGIAYTYNEPSVFFEYARDTAKAANDKGLFNLFVTNGLINEKPLADIDDYLDAVVIDFKGFNEKFYLEYTGAKLDWVKQSVKYYKKLRAWKEVTNLVVPGLNDSTDDITSLVKFIKQVLGVNTPIHFIRFFPLYKATNIPYTPEQVLKRCYDIAKDQGMNYVYIGNDASRDDTHCPKCGSLLIKRSGLRLIKSYLKGKKCPKCGFSVPIIGNIHEGTFNYPNFG